MASSEETAERRLPSLRKQSFHLHFWPALILFAGITMSLFVARSQHREAEVHLRDDVQASVAPIRNALSREVFAAVQLTEGLSALIAVDGDIAGVRFETFVQELFQRNDLIRNIAVAPNNVVRFVYPLEGNDRVIGLDYASNAEQWPAVERMMREGRVNLAGPVTLVQGGFGVIGRTPVYLSTRGEGRAAPRYWGLVSTVMDLERLIARADLSEARTGTRLALRGVDGTGEEGSPFWGDVSVFDAAPVQLDVPLPSGRWSLAAVPRDGWPPFQPWRSLYFLVGALLSAVLAALLSRLLLANAAKAREAEQRRQSDRRFRAIFKQAPLGIAVLDAATNRFRTVNPRFCRITGYDEADLLQRTPLDLGVTDIQDTEGDTEAQPEANEIGTALEQSYRRQDGSRIWVSGKRVPLAAGGSERQRLLLVEDITERREAAQALEQQARELDALNQLGRRVSTMLSLDAVAAAAIEGIMQVIRPDAAFLFLRDGERLLLKAFEPEETRSKYGSVPEHRVGECICGLSVRQGQALYSRDIFEDLRCSWLECKRAGMRSFAALPLRSGDEIFGVVGLSSDRERDFEAQASFLEILASQVAIGLRNATLYEQAQRYAEDLEQRVAARTSELAVARDRAEAADRVKSAFLATMSHELRTPLNSIIGFTGIVLQQLPGPINSEQEKQLGMVQNSARHLLALINDVLDISKIEAGELVVAAEPFEPSASIARVLGIVKPLAEKKGLQLSIAMPEQPGTMVGDARRVEQVLLNLLSNAIKFTEHGSVMLEVAMPEVDPRFLHLTVRDTGIGIKAEDLATLFQPFRQVETTIARSHEGTGLGLAICRRLATLMGGSIEATSRFGEGSSFTVRLPRFQR